MKYILSVASCFLFVFCLGGLSWAEGDYVKKSSKYNVLEKKIIETKKLIKERIKQKNSTKDTKVQGEIFATIVSLHKELDKTIREYNDLGRDLKYKYPEKGDKAERKYLPIRPQSVEEIEQETGIDGVLSRVKEKVEQKYMVFTRGQEEEDREKEVKTLKPNKEEVKKIRLEK